MISEGRKRMVWIPNTIFDIFQGTQREEQSLATPERL